MLNLDEKCLGIAKIVNFLQEKSVKSFKMSYDLFNFLKYVSKFHRYGSILEVANKNVGKIHFFRRLFFFSRFNDNLRKKIVLIISTQFLNKQYKKISTSYAF